jgi:disulfide bond formation protein DsbB
MISTRDPRFPFLLGGTASLGLVVCGVLLAEFMRLAACPLCIWQRIFYLLFGLFAFIGLACADRACARRGMAVLMMTAAGGGAGVAGYQVWIQRFSPMTTCVGKEPWWEAFIRVAGEQVPLLFKASGLCSDPAWKFLALSIADWSLLLFVGLFGLSAYAALRRQGGQNNG